MEFYNNVPGNTLQNCMYVYIFRYKISVDTLRYNFCYAIDQTHCTPIYDKRILCQIIFQNIEIVINVGYWINLCCHTNVVLFRLISKFYPVIIHFILRVSENMSINTFHAWAVFHERSLLIFWQFWQIGRKKSNY